MAAEVLDAAQAPTVEDARRAAAIAAADRRVEQVLVFGSVARGEAGRQSDIDLLVLLGEVSPEEWGDASSSIAAAVRSGANWPVNVIVQPRADFEHLSRHVTASFEHTAAGEALVLYQSSPVLPPANGNLSLNMPSDNLALAAEQMKSVNRYLFSLMDALESIPAGETRANAVSSGGDVSIEEIRRNRYLVLLESAHMAIEQSFRGAAAASEGLSLGGGHEIDKFIEIMGDTQEKAALEAAVAPIRESDGNLRCWRLVSYTGHLSEWSAEATAENASAHIGAAMACAEVAAAAIERRAAGDDSLLMPVRVIRESLRLLEDAPSTPDGIKTGRLAAPRRRFKRLFGNRREHRGRRAWRPSRLGHIE